MLGGQLVMAEENGAPTTTAHPSIDAWAVGAVAYEIFSGCALPQCFNKEIFCSWVSLCLSVSEASMHLGVPICDATVDMRAG